VGEGDVLPHSVLRLASVVVRHSKARVNFAIMGNVLTNPAEQCIHYYQRVIFLGRSQCPSQNTGEINYKEDSKNEKVISGISTDGGSVSGW
jgi:hypothetical protein